MYRHNRKIIALVALVIALMFIATASYTEYIQKNKLKGMAEQLLQAESAKEAVLFNQELKAVENTTQEIIDIVQTSFDFNKLRTETDYMKQYVKQIDDNVKRLAQNSPITKSAYVFFLPQIDQAPHDVWYADLNADGQVEKQSTFPLSYYDGDIKWKQWFYVPLETKQPYWTDPYIGTIESDQDIIYFSYTAPIIVDGKVVGIAGSDYYFNKLKDSLVQYNLRPNSQTFLINKSFDVLIHPTISFGVNLFDYLPGLTDEQKNQMQTQSEGKFGYFDPGSQKKTMFYEQLDNGWYLMFSLEDKAVITEDKSIALRMRLVPILATLIVLSLLYLVVKKLMSPLVYVNNSLQKMLLHDYEQIIPNQNLRRSDLSGALSRVTESLRIACQETYRQSKVAEEDMSASIQEKTQELIKTNEFLELSLTQLQEQNSEMNIANEKYEDQVYKLQLLQDRLFMSEQLASLAYILVGLAYDLNSPIGNSTTMISYLKSERNNTLRKLQDDQLKKQDLIEFMLTLEESLELLERNMTIASKQVVQFKRLSSGQNHYVKSEFSLKDTLTHVFNQSTTSNSNMNVRLNLSVPDITVIADQGAFIQVFSNLLRYSLGFSYQQISKGIISIRGELVDENSLLLTYEDFGQTTPKAILETAFVPYLTTQFQDQPQVVQLNICYHIITKVFEGSIRFESQAEEGNRFYMVMKVKITKS